MLIKDRLGIILDNTGDGGDSCNRTSIYCAFKEDEENILHYFVNSRGICVRYPFQRPWNNPRNFSRDQLIPLIYGLSKSEEGITIVRKILWATVKRGFFAQNFERDNNGTKKYPWPHSFLNDKGEEETRNFDFADPILPDVILQMIICGKMYPFYLFYLIGLPWFLISLFVHCKAYRGDDEGQSISLCASYGSWALVLYRKWRSDYKDRLWQYWKVRRNQEEIYSILEAAVTSARK